MKILITGGAGFIGAHVARSLLNRGDDVVIFDDFNSAIYPSDLKEARLAHLAMHPRQPTVVRGSILDRAALDALFAKAQFDAVLHLAAHANPGLSMNRAAIYTENNVNGTLNVLLETQQHGVSRLVLAGSSSVYNDEQTPFQEDQYPLRPRSPYGASKAAAEMYCQLWHEQYGQTITVLRFFSVYGPWGRPDMAPSVFTEKILTGLPIELNRDESRRDFTFISDVVLAILAALDRDRGFEIINVGRGEPTKLTDLVKAIEAAAGRSAKVIERDTPPGEMSITYADITKAKALLNYNPKVSVTEGAKELVDWMKTYYLPQSEKQKKIAE